MQTALIPTEHRLQNSLNNVSIVTDDALRQVVGALLGSDYSLNSRKALASDLKHFLAWYVATNGEGFSFKRVTQRDITDYREAMKKGGLAVATINRRLITLKRFFAVAAEQEVTSAEKNPTSKVKTLRAQELAPKSLTPQDARRFLKEVEVRGNLRDMAIMELMIGAGLRVSEVINLEASDIELSERKGTALIRNAKGGKTRTVPLRLSVRTLLSQYIEQHKPTGKLFMGQRGTLTTHAITKLVAKYGRKAGVILSPHTLRHTFSTSFLVENPSEIVALSQILGHRSVATTAIYTQNRLEDLQAKVDAVMQ